MTTLPPAPAAHPRPVPVEPRAAVPWVLASLSLSTLLAALGTSSANVALPALAGEFAASFPQVQWVVLAYLLAMTSLIVAVGRLGDLTGRRRLLIAGAGLFAAGSVWCGVAPSLGWLVAARVPQGLGGAIMTALSIALVGEALPKAKAAQAMGLLGAMSATGTALGPALGGALIAVAGWRAIFLAQAPLALLVLFLVRRHLPADRETSDASFRGFDYPGAVLLAIALAAYALAMTGGRGSFGTLNLVLLLAAGGGLAAFVLVEARSPAPLVRVAMFRDPVLRANLATSAAVATVVMATLIVGPFYLARTLRLDPLAIGPALAVGPVVAALAGIPAGRATGRHGVRAMTVAGLLGMTAGSLALALLPASLGLGAYLAAIALITGSYALFQTANNTAVMGRVRPDERGVTSGLLNLSRNLGLISGASLMGAVFAHGAGTAAVAQASPEGVAAGLRLTFAFATVLLLGALALAAGRRPPALEPAVSGALRT